jgi:hypothetical protein
VRTEASAANAHPPITWTPVYFGPELAFNQVGFSAPDTDPLWRDAFDIPSDSPTHHFAWIAIGDEVRNVVRVHRRDTMIHPLTLAPLCMEIEAEDETGDVHRVSGEAIAFTPVPTWPNLASYETLLRWEDESGRVAHGPGQSIWSSKAQHAMRANADPLGRVR